MEQKKINGGINKGISSIGSTDPRLLPALHLFARISIEIHQFSTVWPLLEPAINRGHKSPSSSYMNIPTYVCCSRKFFKAR